MKTYSSIGHPYRLGHPIGQGGEATIYELADYPDLLAKIYLRDRPGYDQKLTWMRDHPPDDPTRDLNHASIAWPLDLLFDARGKFIGYLMPYIEEAAPLLSVFNPRLRARDLPEFDTAYLYHTARNLAVALQAIHEREYVVGDLNESNVMVTPSTLVTMIDTDSFQVRAHLHGGHTRLFPCLVGKPEYTPPELQKVPLDRVERLPEHDYFGLGVLIFQLLMDGSHPFRARWGGTVQQPPIEERIQRGWFPYLELRGVPISPPTNALPLESLPPAVTDLVYRCFVDGHKTPSLRPSPLEWADALVEAESLLGECDNGHIFSTHQRDCPWCEREAYVEFLESRPPPPPKGIPPPLLPPPIAPPYAPAPPRPGLFSPLASGITPRTIMLVVYQLVSGALGQVLVGGMAGALGGGMAGTMLGGALGSRIVGGAGGLVGGAIVSDTIGKKDAWEFFWGGLGGAAGGWFAWLAGVSPVGVVVGAGIGAVVGAVFGNFTRRFGMEVLWALFGGIGGWLAGRAIGDAVAEAWVAGALSGAAFGALNAALYHVRKRI